MNRGAKLAIVAGAFVAGVVVAIVTHENRTPSPIPGGAPTTPSEVRRSVPARTPIRGNGRAETERPHAAVTAREAAVYSFVARSGANEWDDDRRNDTWADAMEPAVVRATGPRLNREVPEANVASAACLTRTCRLTVEVTESGDAALAAFLPALITVNDVRMKLGERQVRDDGVVTYSVDLLFAGENMRPESLAQAQAQVDREHPEILERLREHLGTLR